MYNKKKLFIAIDLPGEVKDDLYSNAYQIEKFASIKKIQPTNFHLTLVFIGLSDRKREKEISDILSDIKSEPFIIEFDDIGEFKKRGGNVVWQGIVKNKYLSNLQENIVKSLNANDIILKVPNFMPHVTLGRKFKLDDGISLDELNEKLILPLSFYVREFHLFESKSIDNKLVYDIIETFKLN